MLVGLEVVAPAAAAVVVAGPATAVAVAAVAVAAVAVAAGPGMLGAAVPVAALARPLWRIPVGGVESSRFFARDLFFLAPDRNLRAMWATLAALPAPRTTTRMSEPRQPRQRKKHGKIRGKNGERDLQAPRMVARRI